MTSKEILTKVIDHLGLKPTEFQVSLHISPRSTKVNDVLSGRTNRITGAFADSIRAVYPQFNKKYLILGRGAMLNTDEDPSPTEGLSASVIINTLMYIYGFANHKQFAEAVGVDRSWVYNLCKDGISPFVISKARARLIRERIDQHLNEQWLHTGKGHVYTDGRPDPYAAIEAASAPAIINDLSSPISEDIPNITSSTKEQDFNKLVKAFTSALEEVKSINDARYQEILAIMQKNGYELPHQEVNYAAEELSKSN